jgi:hypothetical protein
MNRFNEINIQLYTHRVSKEEYKRAFFYNEVVLAQENIE